MRKTRKSGRSAYLWILLSYWITWGGGCAVASAQVWTVRMSGEDTFSVESRNLYVDFSKDQAWTIRNIKYMGQEIVGEYGANGTV